MMSFLEFVEKPENFKEMLKDLEEGIVRFLRFLLSEDASYVTSTVVPLDAGTRAAFIPLK